jgi:hypothetical protein
MPSDPNPCPRCKGTRRVMLLRPHLKWPASQSETDCPDCTAPPPTVSPCPRCGGSGELEQWLQGADETDPRNVRVVKCPACTGRVSAPPADVRQGTGMTQAERAELERLHAAVLAEREACARLADDHWERVGRDCLAHPGPCFDEVAAAIRARAPAMTMPGALALAQGTPGQMVRPAAWRAARPNRGVGASAVSPDRPATYTRYDGSWELIAPGVHEATFEELCGPWEVVE